MHVFLSFLQGSHTGRPHELMMASHSANARGVQPVTLGIGLLGGLMLAAGYGLAQWLVIEHLH